MHVHNTPRPFEDPFENLGELPTVIPDTLYRIPESDARDLYRMTLDQVLELALRQMEQGRIYEIGIHRVLSQIVVNDITGLAQHPALDIDAVMEPPPGFYHSDIVIREVFAGLGRVVAKHPSAEKVSELVLKLERLAIETRLAEAKIAHLRPTRLEHSLLAGKRLLEGYSDCTSRESKIDSCMAELVPVLGSEARSSDALALLDEVAYEFGKLLQSNKDDGLFWKVAAACGLCARVEHKLTPQNSDSSTKATIDRQIAHKLRAVNTSGHSYCERRYSRSRDRYAETIALMGERNTQAKAILRELIGAEKLKAVIKPDFPENYTDSYAVYLGVHEALDSL